MKGEELRVKGEVKNKINPDLISDNLVDSK